ncbi:MAG: hypothetical protein F4X96_06705 [Gammaproteobacteria bacterium]|nr:hypothetical protein [Gammaproteobacteria bacterium]
MKAMIAWFATNSVAANLLMGFAVLAGLASLGQIPVKLYPDFDLPVITVTVPYLGAAPDEVESGICTRIEEQIEGINGIKEVRSTAMEGRCNVVVELFHDADRFLVLDDVDAQINAIDTFPQEAEKPIIQLVTPSSVVMEIAVTGPADERALKEMARRVRDDILRLDGVTHAEVTNARPYEISVEVSELSLSRNNLTFDDVANALRQRSLDLPGGTVKTREGEVLLRTSGQAYWGREIENLLVTTRNDGTRVLVKDVARVVDGFEDTSQSLTFNDRPAALVQVSRMGEQDIRLITETVKDFVARSSSRYPEGVQVQVWKDESKLVTGRLGALVDSGVQGLLLVLLLLALFLRPHLALWVAAGIPIAFLGALFLMYSLGFSIDSISVIGFILALGMLVDDAVVVGESTYVAHRRGAGQLAGAIQGTQQVMVPVTFGVLTTVAAFMPLLFSVGRLGQIFSVISGTVICCLAFSLIECQMVLPAHLGHRRTRMPLGEFGMTVLAAVVIGAFAITPDPRTAVGVAIGGVSLVYAAHITGALGRLGARFARVQVMFESALEALVQGRFRDLARAAYRNRVLTLAISLAALIVSISIVLSGHLPFTFFTPIQGDTVTARLRMPLGTSEATTQGIIEQLADSARDLREQLAEDQEKPIVLHIVEAMGGHPSTAQPGSAIPAPSGAHLGEVTIQLNPSEERDIRTEEVGRMWREAAGSSAASDQLSFITERIERDPEIWIRFAGENIGDLRRIADEFRGELLQYPGVFGIADSLRDGKAELELSVTPAGEALGITLADLGRQVRQAFYGEEAQRIQRGRDDVRLMVRYPEEQRRSLDSLFSLRVRTPEGGEVPFATVAEVSGGRGLAEIQRTNGSRTVDVSAEVDPRLTSAEAVMAELNAGFLSQVLRRYDGVSFTVESAREQQETVATVGPLFLLALFAIFALLALPLRSYSQPLIIMAVLPFAFVGAVWGHVILKLFGPVVGLSMASVFGIVAASGVVVNSTLVLIHGVNRFRAAGDGMEDALLNAAVSRFRPILITTVTTFAGVAPLMLSNSVPAQPLVPMAASLAFGVVFSSVAALLFVPALWLVLLDISGGTRRVTDRVVAGVIGASPRLSQWMARYPYVQESLRAQEFTDLQLPEDLDLDPEMEKIARQGLVRVYYQREFDIGEMRAQLGDVAARAPNVSDAVSEARTWAEERTFQLGAHIAGGTMAPVEAAGPLTDILETCLASLLPAARSEFTTQHGEISGSRIALVALGPAGRREFVAGGPLELLFVCDREDRASTTATLNPTAWHAQFVQFFTRLIREFSAEGILLRPVPPYALQSAGRETFAPTLAAAGRHFDESADSADLRMLVHARVFEAEGDLGDRFETFRRSVLTRSHDAGAIAADIAAVRSSLAQRHKDSDTWEIRRRTGGLAELELAAEFLQLMHARHTPEVLVHGLIPTFEAAGKHELIDARAASGLVEAATLWQNLEGFFQMTSGEAFDPESASDDQKARIADLCGVGHFDELGDLIAETALVTARILDRTFAG